MAHVRFIEFGMKNFRTGAQYVGILAMFSRSMGMGFILQRPWFSRSCEQAGFVGLEEGQEKVVLAEAA